MKTPRIAVVGSFMQASCWQVDRLPMLGETRAAAGFHTEPAGKGLAVALGCRRLGAEVDLLLAIGEDAAGDALLERLRAEDLRTPYVQRYPVASGQGSGWLTADGGNAIAAFRGANARLDAQQVANAATALSQADVVYAQFEAPVDAALEAFARGRAQGACTVLNPSPWQSLPPELLSHTQVLLVNELEARQLLDNEATLPDAAGDAAWTHAIESLWTRWPGDDRRWLVVTLGKRGSMAVGPQGMRAFVPGLTVSAENSIGAGDAFAAALCVALGLGLDIEQVLARGNASGAFAVSRRGILDGLPRADELDEWLRSSAAGDSGRHRP